MQSSHFISFHIYFIPIHLYLSSIIYLYFHVSILYVFIVCLSPITAWCDFICTFYGVRKAIAGGSTKWTTGSWSWTVEDRDEEDTRERFCVANVVHLAGIQCLHLKKNFWLNLWPLWTEATEFHRSWVIALRMAGVWEPLVKEPLASFCCWAVEVGLIA